VTLAKEFTTERSGAELHIAKSCAAA